MMRRTHAAAGLALGFGLASVQHQPIMAGTVLALVCEMAALAPDLDIRLHIKHRTVTHSLLALAIVCLGAWYTMPLLLLPVSLGYGSHLLLDFLTVWGIPIFWPKQKRYRLMRLRTGGRIDSLVAVGALCAILWSLIGVVRWNQ